MLMRRPAPSMRWTVARRAACAVVLCNLVTIAHAQDAPARDATDDINTPLPSAANIGQQSIASFLPEPFKTLNGLRPYLADRGLTFAITYQGDTMSNLEGGGRTGSSYLGRLQTTVEFDPEKTTGWKGGLFRVSTYQIHGVGLSQHFVQSLAPVSDLEAVATTRLNEVTFEQKLTDAVTLRFGQFAADTEFFLSPYYGIGIGGTFGWPTITTLDLPSGGPAYPLATPGIRLKVTPTDQLTLLAAVFNGDPAGPGIGNPQHRNRYGFNFRVGDPPFVIAEAQYKYGSAKDGPVYPGTVRLGAWAHFGKFADQRFGVDGLPLGAPSSIGVPVQHRGNVGLYGVLDQQIFQKPGKTDDGIFLIGRVSASPSDRNPIDFYLDGGLNFQGLVPNRPEDQFAFLGALTKVSSAARASDQDANLYNATFTPARNLEALAEATYAIRVREGFLIQPNVQYVFHPGGGGADPRDPFSVHRAPNAVVVGFRTTIQY